MFTIHLTFLTLFLVANSSFRNTQLSNSTTPTYLCLLEKQLGHPHECLRGLVRTNTCAVSKLLADELLAERGVEKRVELDNLSATDVEKKVAQLLSS